MQRVTNGPSGPQVLLISRLYVSICKRMVARGQGLKARDALAGCFRDEVLVGRTECAVLKT